ncbi:MAG: hypothetical protein ACP5N1_06255 [Candidatus Woesearchaeota archaeon]
MAIESNKEKYYKLKYDYFKSLTFAIIAATLTSIIALVTLFANSGVSVDFKTALSNNLPFIIGPFILTLVTTIPIFIFYYLKLCKIYKPKTEKIVTSKTEKAPEWILNFASNMVAGLFSGLIVAFAIALILQYNVGLVLALISVLSLTVVLLLIGLWLLSFWKWRR